MFAPMKRVHDLNWLQTRFNQFNNQIFCGRLPLVDISLSSATKTLGKCQQKTDSAGNKIFKLTFTTAVAMEDSVREDVVIHEMIHLFIGWNGLVDSGPHGFLFKALMNSINAAHGRHITIRVNSEETDTATTTKASRRSPMRVVIVLHFRDGSRGIKVLPKVRPTIVNYLRAAERMTDVTFRAIYFTDNPFFHRYPVSGALRYHRVDPNELNMALDTAKALSEDSLR